MKTLLLLYIAFQFVTLAKLIKGELTKSEILEALDKRFPDRWLDVPLDHFNLFDNRTFKMRYKVNREFFKKWKPLFIEVGGEWSITGYKLRVGPLHTLAKKHKGMLIETEHRYYGKSNPFPLYKNYTVEDLQYLQIQQALEDLVYFIEHFKSINPKTKNSKVIVHGCSYPAMLVTWLRLKFPHVVDIAYASSAPLGLGIQTDYPEYYEVINDVYANVSSSCIDTIREGINQTEMLMKTESGRKLVANALREWSCGDVDTMTSYVILQMYKTVLNVMHDPYHYEDVSCLALVMNTDDTEAYERLASFVVLKSKDTNICEVTEEENSMEYEYLDEDGEESEELLEDEEKEELSETERNSLGWSYQACTEIGCFTTLNRTNTRHPFGIDVSVQDFLDGCNIMSNGMITKEIIHKGVNTTIHRYGGKKPIVTKVVTVQGTHDPWRHLLVFEDYNAEAPVYIVDGSHCSDSTIRQDDPDVLLEFRKKVINRITEWIKEIS